MKKYLICTDLDGTFLSPGNEDDFFKIHPENFEAIEMAIKDGHIVSIATGRPWPFVKPLIDILPKQVAVIMNNGSMVYIPWENRIIHSHRISSKTANGILENKELLKLMNSFMVSGQTKTYVNSAENVYGINAEKQIDNVIWYVHESGKEFDEKISAMNISVKNNEKINDVVNELKIKFGNEVNFFSWCEQTDNDFCTIDVFPKSINKYSSIVNLAEFYNIPHENTIAFGDNLNDLEMIKGVKLGIAMQNAKSEIKEVADEITEFDNSKGGVGIHLKKLLNKIK